MKKNAYRQSKKSNINNNKLVEKTLFFVMTVDHTPPKGKVVSSLFLKPTLISGPNYRGKFKYL